jgi:hypothetical protein
MANLNTSPLGAALQVRGLLIKVGTGSSPETEDTIFNGTDMKLGMKSKIVDVTNFGDTFMRQIPTLLTFGPLTFTVFYQPLDTSHRNSPPVGTVAAGLKYLWINEVLADWQILYPSASPATDAAAGYVTNFSVDAKTADVFRASVQVDFNDGNPSLV